MTFSDGQPAAKVRAKRAQSEFMEALKLITRLRRSGNLPEALRLADRQWRTAPQQRAQLAPVLGQLLMQMGENPGAAVKVLTRAADLAPSAEREADLIRALLAANLPDFAKQRLTLALQKYACSPNDELATIARILAMRPDAKMSGWMAITPRLEAYVEFTSTSEPAHFQMFSADGTLVASLTAPCKNGLAIATLPIPNTDQPQFIRVSANNEPLLSGERVLPLDFRLKASSTARGTQIEGSASLDWNPTAAVTLEFSDENGRYKRMRTRQGQFELNSEKAKLGTRIQISAQLPDGRQVELADSPLLLKPAVAANLRAISPRPASQTAITRRSSKPPVDIIIPVYLGAEETLACIESVRQTIAQAASIIVIDDASPDLALASELDTLAEAGHITLFRNPINLGFAASINRAMTVNPSHDAVLVNSDVIVFGEWLARLRNAAYRQNDIATVTPFSDDDSIARYGDQNPENANAHLAAELNTYAAQAHRRKSIELPVGVGFCMYIRRAAWQEAGEFDAATFGKGYGEESDWCMRARKRGWQHQLAADVFVHHAGGRSFESRRLALLTRAQRLMNLRYPGYDRSIQRFLKADPLHALRRSFDAQRLRSQTRPTVLLVTLALGGGVDRYVNERCQTLRDQGKLPLVLRPHKMSPDACMLWNVEPRLQHLHFRIPDEHQQLRLLLASLPIESVEFHHFLGLDPRLVKTALSLGIPYDVFLHDYSWICPRVTLMDETGRYCGEPNLASCNRCIKRNGSELTEDISVGALRRRSQRWLAGAQRIYAPTQDSAQRYLRRFPKLKITVAPLESNVTLGAPPRWRRKGPIRVALLGAIGEHKGYKALLSCARDAQKRELDLEFLLIGYSSDDAPLLKTGKVFITGQYGDGEVASLLAREKPDLIWLPSVWPETWCYTLSHALKSGLPVVTFNIGAMAERLREMETGNLLSLGLSTKEINARLLAIGTTNIA